MLAVADHSFGLVLWLCFVALFFGHCFKYPFYNPIFRNIFKAVVKDSLVYFSFFFYGMVVRTTSFFATFLFALLSSIEGRVILLFFPAVTHVACCSHLTSRIIVVYIAFSLPVEAWNWLVAIVIRIASIVLPIVGVHAFSLIVLSKVEGTPLCFVVEHVEIIIFCVVVDEIEKNVLF